MRSWIDSVCAKLLTRQNPKCGLPRRRSPTIKKSDRLAAIKKEASRLRLASPLILVQLDPVYVTFNPSETDLVAIQRARATGKVAADILLPGETQARHGGELTFIDNAVDRSTGTIVARATIGNADLGLLPGQYVRIRLAIGTEPDALMVPEAALGSSQLGKYVYVVGEGNKVDQRLVSLGPSDGGLVAVLKGVSEGERVINGNLQKIGPGALVQPLLQ